MLKIVKMTKCENVILNVINKIKYYKMWEWQNVIMIKGEHDYSGKCKMWSDFHILNTTRDAVWYMLKIM